MLLHGLDEISQLLHELGHLLYEASQLLYEVGQQISDNRQGVWHAGHKSRPSAGKYRNPLI